MMDILEFHLLMPVAIFHERAFNQVQELHLVHKTFKVLEDIMDIHLFQLLMTMEISHELKNM